MIEKKVKDEYMDKEVRKRRGKGLGELIDVYMECEWVRTQYDALKYFSKRKFKKDYSNYMEKFEDPFFRVIPEYMLEGLNCAYENTK